MKPHNFFKKLPLLLVAVLVLTACFSIGSMAIIDDTAFATSTLQVGKSETITIAHITDTHYFPLEYCYAYTMDENGQNVEYVDKKSAFYLASDFYDSTTGDTKLVTESGAILNAIIQSILKVAGEKVSALEDALGTPNEDAAYEDLDMVPDYILLSGDLTKDSERVSLIDVANAFRYLQNEMRLIKYTDGTDVFPFENFQVFGVPGNHDLYNGKGLLYDNIRDNGILDGSGHLADTTDTRLFAMIFAGLGFPDVTPEIMENVFCEQVKIGATLLPTGLSNPEYWYGDYTGSFIYSPTAKNLKLHYYSENIQNIADAKIADFENLDDYYKYLIAQYNEISAENNVLSSVVEILDGKAGDATTLSTGYSIVMCDSSDRKETTKLVPVVASPKQILEKQNLYTFDEATNHYNPVAEDLSQIKDTIESGKVLYFNTGIDHITGGKVTVKFLDWIENDVLNNESKTVSSNNSGFLNTSETIVFTCHQNVLPHFDQEDDLLKDFTIYNWEYVAKRLLKMNIRYTLTGHMHSSDIASYVDAAGNVLYDFETGSTVSFSAPVRNLVITRDYYFDETDYVVAEEVITFVNELQTLAEIQSSNISAEVGWNDVDVSSLDTEEAKFLARYTANPDFFLYSYAYDELREMTYNSYIDSELYSDLLNRMVGHFLSMNMIDSLKNTLGDFFNGTFRTMLGSAFADYADVTNKLALSMIEQLLNGMTYTYNNQQYTGTNEDPALLKMAKAIVDDFIDIGYGLEGHKISLRNLTVNILLNHTTGREFPNLDAVLNAVEPEAGSSEYEFDRYYFACAVRELILDCEDGSLVQTLLNALLEPILLDDTSLLKTLLAYKFDFSALGLSDDEIESANGLFSVAIDLLNAIMDDDAPQLTTDMVSLDSFCLGDILNTAQGFLSSLLANTFGIFMGDMGVIEFAEDFISKYMVESFFTGTGGIAKNIIVAFVVDTVQDFEDPLHQEIPYFLQFARDYEKDNTYAVIKTSNVDTEDIYYTYVQGQTVSREFNPATTKNGRLPSKITSNFDIVNSQSEFAFSFYTDEDIFAKFEILDDGNNVVAVVETTPDGVVTYNKTFTEPGKIGWETRVSSVTTSSGTIEAQLVTTTMPAYIPLIDLGILCLTHSEITYKLGDNEYAYSADMRDGNLDRPELHIGNSVIFKNHHTINIKNLHAGKTYRYRLYGSYESEFFALHDELGIDFFTMTTAPDSSQQKFEFLAIADLQASILSDYQISAKVFDKLASNEAINNYDFILNAGDMTDNGKNFYQWGWALDTMAQYFANTSTFITSGNHEEGSSALTNYFNYTLESGVNNTQDTENGIYYSIDYGTLHLVVLDTNDADKAGLGKDQLAWLKNDLSANTSKWTIVLMHKGLYTAGAHSRDLEVVAMRNQLTPLFAEHRVDIVIAGHDHTYTTTSVVDKKGNVVNSATDKDGYVINADGGVIYMTIGTFGQKFYEYGENDAVTPKLDKLNSVTKTLDSPTFTHFAIDGDRLVISGYKYAGALADLEQITSIKITKALGAVGTAVQDATINDEPLVFGKKYVLKYFSLKNNLAIDLSDVEQGSSIAYFVDGQEVDGLNFGLFEGSKTVEIKLKDSSGNFTSLGVIEIERENFVLYTALIFAGIAVLIAAIVATIILSVKKKKSGQPTDGTDNGSKKEIVQNEVVVADLSSKSKTTVGNEELKKEVTTDVDYAVEKKKTVEKKVETKTVEAKEVTVKKPAVKATAPKATAPKATAPKATAPKATAPKATAPKATAPKATASKATAPKATAPKATATKTAVPKSTAPKATATKPAEKATPKKTEPKA